MLEIDTEEIELASETERPGNTLQAIAVQVRQVQSSYENFLILGCLVQM